MRYKQKTGSKGFSLIEVLIVVAIMGMLLLSLTKITSDGIKVYKRGIVQTEMKSQIRKAMDSITSDLRQASTAGWISPSRTTDTVGTVKELKFKRYIYNSSDEASPSEATIEYTFESDTSNTGYYMLTRKITENSVVRYSILADNLKYVANSEAASYIRWNPDGMDSTKADTNSLLVVLVMERFSSNVREEIRVQTAVAIRSEEQHDPDSSDSPPYYAAKYGVFMDSPSSLEDPREDY